MAVYAPRPKRRDGGTEDAIQFDSTLFSTFAAVMAATRIWLDDAQFAGFAGVQAHAAQIGADTVITYDAAMSVTLKNVALASLGAADFGFF